jgi:hypothetical protein
MRHRFSLLLIIAAIIGMVGACKKSPEPIPCNGTSPTWNSRAQKIVDRSCTAGACHGAGSVNGDFTKYATIKPHLDNGTFEQQVLVDRTMPEGSTLPDTTLAMLQCWFEHGYPEN